MSFLGEGRISVVAAVGRGSIPKNINVWAYVRPCHFEKQKKRKIEELVLPRVRYVAVVSGHACMHACMHVKHSCTVSVCQAGKKCR